VGSTSGCNTHVSAVYDPVANAVSPFSSAPRGARAAGVAPKGQFFVLGGSENEPDDTGCYVGTGRVTAEVWAYTP
jgi:hypothetical protein